MGQGHSFWVSLGMHQGSYDDLLKGTNCQKLFYKAISLIVKKYAEVGYFGKTTDVPVKTVYFTVSAYQ